MKLLYALLLIPNLLLAQERSYEYLPNVNFVITDERCGKEPNLLYVYAKETVLNETLNGCYYKLSGEVMIRIFNGVNYQDYRFLESNFE